MYELWMWAKPMKKKKNYGLLKQIPKKANVIHILFPSTLNSIIKSKVKMWANTFIKQRYKKSQKNCHNWYTNGESPNSHKQPDKWWGNTKGMKVMWGLWYDVDRALGETEIQ